MPARRRASPLGDDALAERPELLREQSGRRRAGLRERFERREALRFGVEALQCRERLRVGRAVPERVENAIRRDDAKAGGGLGRAFRELLREASICWRSWPVCCATSATRWRCSPLGRSRCRAPVRAHAPRLSGRRAAFACCVEARPQLARSVFGLLRCLGAAASADSARAQRAGLDRFEGGWIAGCRLSRRSAGVRTGRSGPRRPAATPARPPIAPPEAAAPARAAGFRVPQGGARSGPRSGGGAGNARRCSICAMRAAEGRASQNRSAARASAAPATPPSRLAARRAPNPARRRSGVIARAAAASVRCRRSAATPAGAAIVGSGRDRARRHRQPKRRRHHAACSKPRHPCGGRSASAAASGSALGRAGSSPAADRSGSRIRRELRDRRLDFARSGMRGVLGRARIVREAWPGRRVALRRCAGVRGSSVRLVSSVPRRTGLDLRALRSSVTGSRLRDFELGAAIWADRMGCGHDLSLQELQRRSRRRVSSLIPPMCPGPRGHGRPLDDIARAPQIAKLRSGSGRQSGASPLVPAGGRRHRPTGRGAGGRESSTPRPAAPVSASAVSGAAARIVERRVE